MRLYELFDRTVPYTVTIKTYGKNYAYIGRFKINNKKYKAMVYVRTDSMINGLYEAVLTFILGKADMHITGTGDQYTVFSTIIKFYLEILEKDTKIKYIEFASDESEISRISLYQKMVDYFVKRTEWKQEEGDEHIFFLSRD